MRKLLSWAVAVCLATLAWSATPAASTKKKKTAVKKTAPKTSASAKKTSAKGKAPLPKGVTWRNRQLTPTPDRYREIQEALASKGYMSAQDVSGTWNATSMEAMKRFQADQSLDSSGKINSMSLIALGLGPKRDPVPDLSNSPRQ